MTEHTCISYTDYSLRMKNYKIFLFFSGKGYLQGHLHYIQVSLWYFIWLVNSISFLQNIHYLSILYVKKIPILPCWCWAWPCDLLVCQNISRQTEHKKRLGLASSPCLFAGYYFIHSIYVYPHFQKITCPQVAPGLWSGLQNTHRWSRSESILHPGAQSRQCIAQGKERPIQLGSFKLQSTCGL